MNDVETKSYELVSARGEEKVAFPVFHPTPSQGRFLPLREEWIEELGYLTAEQVEAIVECLQP